MANPQDPQAPRNMQKITNVVSWILCAICLLLAIAISGALPKVLMIAVAVLLCPLIRHRLHLGRKVWIPLVVVLFLGGLVSTPTAGPSAQEAADVHSISDVAESSLDGVKDVIPVESSPDKAAEPSNSEEEAGQPSVASGEENLSDIATPSSTSASTANTSTDAPAVIPSAEDVVEEPSAPVAGTPTSVDTVVPSAEEPSAPVADTPTSVGMVEPSASESTPVSTADSGETMVWIPTNGGQRYHSNSTCSDMKDPVQVTISEAQAQGYTPCKKCY